MGNSYSDNAVLGQTQYRWITLEPKQCDISGHPSVCMTERGELVADCYDFFSKERIDHELNFLQIRENLNKRGIVKLVDARLKQKQRLNCCREQGLQIYTQKILCRLDEVDLNEDQAFFILGQILYICQELFSFAGCFFTLNPQMIGFGCDGLVRVWLNENFGSCEVKQQDFVRNQYESLMSILKCFEKYSFDLQEFYHFRTIQQLLLYINFARENQSTVHISRCLASKIKNNAHWGKYCLKDQFLSKKSCVNRPSIELRMNEHQMNEHQMNQHQMQEILFVEPQLKSPRQWKKQISKNQNYMHKSCLKQVGHPQNQPYRQYCSTSLVTEYKSTPVKYAPSISTCSSLGFNPASSTASFNEKSPRMQSFSSPVKNKISFQRTDSPCFELSYSSLTDRLSSFKEDEILQKVQSPSKRSTFQRHLNRISEISEQFEEGNTTSYLKTTSDYAHPAQMKPQGWSIGSLFAKRDHHQHMNDNQNQWDYFTRLEL